MTAYKSFTNTGTSPSELVNNNDKTRRKENKSIGHLHVSRKVSREEVGTH